MDQENQNAGQSASEHHSGDPDSKRGEPPDSSLVTHVTHRSMATDFVVLLPARWASQVELVIEVLEQLDEIERALTVYRPDSEVSRANLLAATDPVTLSEPTFALLQRAVLWSRRTHGAFDITAGPLVQAWGFISRSGRKPSTQEVDAALRCVGYERLRLCEQTQTVQFSTAGMSINLGAIGKGDALDRLAQQLRSRGLPDFLIHGGNSSVIASGDQTPGSGLGWAVGISHPTKPKRRLGGVWLHDAALSTSGSGKQFFHHRGRRYGHVIDPRTGYPAGDLMSLTVLMNSAADADACATGLFVASRQEREQLRSEPWFPTAIAVRSGDRQDAVEIESIGEVPWVTESQSGVSHGEDVSRGEHATDRD